VEIIRILEKIVGIRQEILGISEKLNHLQRELDQQAADMIEALRRQGIIEKKS
jgi:hypothetical protein